MAELAGPDRIESLRVELAGLGRSIRSSFRANVSSSFRSVSSVVSGHHSNVVDDEDRSQWEAVERLPTFERITTALFEGKDGTAGIGNASGKRIVNVAELGAQDRHMLIEKLIKHIEIDNLRLLQKIRNRIDKVGVKLPTVEVRYKNLSVQAECQLVHGKPLPTLWNTTKSICSGFFNLPFSEEKAKITILEDVSGSIKPGRMTLLIGPPGSGKTTMLLALSGKLSHSLKVSGEISYNGYQMDEFVPQKTSVYISQYDLHIPDMTVRETIDFSAWCQGIANRAEIMKEVIKREKQEGIIPEPDVDAYMKAISVKGLESTLQTDYILKILGLDICADTLVGDVMRRGISGGQKKRLTTGEMIVGPSKAVFMDEISNGLDSSTTFQIVACLQHWVHLTDATALIALLQPAPETFELFDDIILMAEGKVIYHGPRSNICKFFEDCGFRCPQRKAVADFLQEVISRKDQEQYWYHAEQPYSYVSVDEFMKKFRECRFGQKLEEELSKPFDKPPRNTSNLAFKRYSLSKWELLKACTKRELLLMKRNSFTYVFKSTQLVIVASITMTVLPRTRMSIDVIHGNYYMGGLFFALVILIVDGFPELQMTVSRLAVFHKHREFCFYPAWAYAIPAALLKTPLSFLESLVWTSLTYYVIGYSPEVGRFFSQFLILFLIHMMSISMFRFLGSLLQSAVSSLTAGTISILLVLMFGGFIIQKPSMPVWLAWGFWISPVTYGEIGLTVNEFLAPRWQKIVSDNTTLGHQLLEARGLNFDAHLYWISAVVLIGFTVLFNIGFTLALTFVKPPGNSRAIISFEKYNQLKGKTDTGIVFDKEKTTPGDHPNSTTGSTTGRMVLPFEPHLVTFQEVQYYVDTPVEMKKRGFEGKKLQLLSDVNGVFRPGILTAMMGVSGAGKTTLMDVLSGRKTGGTIEGDIRISGYPKVHDTFARISGYCEQTDIHSPLVTVQESVIFSAWLRLPSELDLKTKSEFVNEVLETIELDGLKDSLVGLSGTDGLSTEQRKRLTIAVELVANPSFIFMDEPTTGLDARSAAIVMRAVKNIVETGRTVVCTIHQPSIDIFEAFDELILMKVGGRIIYAGPLGQHSSRVIEYFESIPGVPKIKDNYNPATWMLEVTSISAEAELGVDFGQIYRWSTLYEENQELIKQLSSPTPGSTPLQFPARFSQNGWEQLKTCLWKQNLSYWRNPSHNLMRLAFVAATSILFGLLFWRQGTKIRNQQDMFNISGAIYTAVIFYGINNCSNIVTFVAMERTVLYRERFAGMYSCWAYSFAQVLVEVPYLISQAIIYVIIAYPMIGYQLSAYKIFWSFYVMFCTLLSFNYIGMLLVSVTPNIQVAFILASSIYTILNLFCGFFVPKPRIPSWWLWLYYLSPTSWAINGALTSQYGDINKKMTAFGQPTTIADFLKDYFGFHHDFLGVVASVLIIFPVITASLFAYFIGKLNFQRR